MRDKIPEQDAVGKSILGDDPQSQTSMRNLLQSMMVDKSVNNIVNIATGEKAEVCSAQHALAYLLGQMCGIEISESASTKDIDPNDILDGLESNHNFECPISQVFLVSAMMARTRKTKEFTPTVSLYDSRSKDVLTHPDKLKARMARLRTALAAIHSSQTDNPSLSGPASAALFHGIHLMLDMRGTSDRLLDRLAAEGVCRPAHVIRMWIQKLADAIDPINARKPPKSGESYVIGWTADNADYHLFHRCVSVVPVGNILLGIETEDDTSHFNCNYMKGLGKLS